MHGQHCALIDDVVERDSTTTDIAFGDHWGRCRGGSSVAIKSATSALDPGSKPVLFPGSVRQKVSTVIN